MFCHSTRAPEPDTPAPGAPAPLQPRPDASDVPVAGGPAFDPGARPAGSHKHSPAQDARNRAIGESAERVAIASLAASYGERYVEHVAGRHDGAGCDIRHSPDQGAMWRYAEVGRYTMLAWLAESPRQAAVSTHLHPGVILSFDAGCVTSIDGAQLTTIKQR